MSVDQEQIKVKTCTIKRRVLREVEVVAEPPSYVTERAYWRKFPSEAERLEYEATLLEQWAKELNDFFRDHRSQDAVHLSIRRVKRDICSNCACDWDPSWDDGDNGMACSGCGAGLAEEAAK